MVKTTKKPKQTLKGYIEVTSLSDLSSIIININHIGHLYQNEATYSYGRLEKPKHVKIGVTTHNNGGFSVQESLEKVIELINNAK